MKKPIFLIFSFLLLILIYITACKKDNPGSTNTGNSNGNCVDYTYYGSASCPGGVIVQPGFCCPTATPYFCSGNNTCYASCSAATSACSGTIYHGTSSTGSTGTCNSTTYSGSGGSCTNSGDVRVSSSACCPSSTPYYCSNTNKCYASCTSAASYCNGSIVLGSVSSGNCTWSTTSSYLSIILSSKGTRCGYADSYEITYKNNASVNIKSFVCLQNIDGTWTGQADGTFGTGLAPGETSNHYVCHGTGNYKLFWMLASNYNSGSCSYPSCN